MISKLQKIELSDSLEEKIISKEEILNKFYGVVQDENIKVFNSLRRINKFEYIFQNYYYINTEEERIKKIKQYSTFEIIACVLNKLSLKWYFALHTANDLNNVVWQPSKNIHIINSVYSKQITLNNQKVIFHQMKKNLIKGYSVYKTKNKIQINVSKNKKTLEDFKYFKKTYPQELLDKIKNE